MAEALREHLKAEVVTYHRYLPETHPGFLKKMQKLQGKQISVFPMFPQFSYATTGSIAKWFADKLPRSVVERMRWVKSYPTDLWYVKSFERCLREYLEEKGILEEEAILLFSAHGLPVKFIETGDVYQRECERTFEELKGCFPKALSKLSYQSQFGKEEWIRPYTNQTCMEIKEWGKGRKDVVIVPLSFTSDHIETLFEIENLYLPVVREQGFTAHRCPALNRRGDWVEAVLRLMEEEASVENAFLVRR